jgi:hypothetical protein
MPQENPYAAPYASSLEAAAELPHVNLLAWRVAFAVGWCAVLILIHSALHSLGSNVHVSFETCMRLTLMTFAALGVLWTGTRGNSRLWTLPVGGALTLLLMRVWVA